MSGFQLWNPWTWQLAKADTDTVSPPRMTPAAAHRRRRPKSRPARTAARGFDAGKNGRRTSGWHTDNATPNAIHMGYVPRLRDRSRDLARNNGQALNILRNITGDLVGGGLKPRCNTGDPAKDRRVDKLFSDWAERAEAELELDFYGAQALVARALLESGEVLVRRRGRRSSDGLAVPMQIQIIESDQLDESKSQNNGRAGRIKLGVDFDGSGRRRGYWLLPEHPGDAYGVLGVGTSTSKRVRADDVAHVYQPTRPGQVRGIPWLHAAIKRLWQLDAYADSEEVRKWMESCHVATLEGATEDDVDVADGLGTDGDPNMADDPTGQDNYEWAPGAVWVAPDGRNFKFHSPTPTTGFAEFMGVGQHSVAAAASTPYSIATGDLSKVNFSSGRLGLNQYLKILGPIVDHVIIHRFCRRVWTWFIDTAIAVGEIEPGEYPVKWQKPQPQQVDRMKEAAADLLEVRAGFRSRRSVIEARGRDPEDVLAEISADQSEADANGLSFDSDARGARAALAPDSPDDEAAAEHAAIAAAMRELQAGNVDATLAILFKLRGRAA